MVQTNVFMAAVVLSVAVVGIVDAKAVPLKAINTWKGSVADEKLLGSAPENGVITNAKALGELYKAWGIAGKVPEVDFAKELVLVATTSGSVLNLSANLTETGDLKSIGLATRDLRPGFRYVMISVSKDGVKTVNGKQLPK